MEPSTRILKNTSKDDYNVVGVGEISAGQQVSITTVYQPAVVLENYPGLLDVTDVPAPVSTAASTSSTASTSSATSSTTSGGSN